MQHRGLRAPTALSHYTLTAEGLVRRKAVVDLEFSGRPVVVENPETDDLKAKDALQKHLWENTGEAVN